jgi:hypothetical protein
LWKRPWNEVEKGLFAAELDLSTFHGLQKNQLSTPKFRVLLQKLQC